MELARIVVDGLLNNGPTRRAIENSPYAKEILEALGDVDWPDIEMATGEHHSIHNSRLATGQRDTREWTIAPPSTARQARRGATTAPKRFALQVTVIALAVLLIAPKPRGQEIVKPERTWDNGPTRRYPTKACRLIAMIIEAVKPGLLFEKSKKPRTPDNATALIAQKLNYSHNRPWFPSPDGSKMRMPQPGDPPPSWIKKK